MADEWWSSARAGDGASACSTTVPATDQQDAAEPAATSATSTDYYFRPSLHVDAAATPPSSFLAEVDWTQSYMGGGREVTAGFNAFLQLHGDNAGRHFLMLDQQPDAVDGTAAPVAPAGESRSASLYAGNQYSSYGNMPAAPTMTTKPFSQQYLVSGFLASSRRNSGDVASDPPSMTAKPLLLQAVENKAFKSRKEHVQDACSSTTRRSVPDSPAAANKKPRIATPSTLPTIKARYMYSPLAMMIVDWIMIALILILLRGQVRKEKLGDRITALQQLVSPFGKTDTASVLHEAIEYIRFLHDQVTSLSSPYLRCGRPVQVQQLQQQQVSHHAKDGDEAEDLRSRGLCLVPVASTYAYTVASETAPEFWHPNFGGTFR